MDWIGKKVQHNKFGEALLSSRMLPIFPLSSWRRIIGNIYGRGDLLWKKGLLKMQ